MKLSEPATAITDYLLAVELLVLGSLLAVSSSHMPVRLWAASFILMALAAVAGGTFHARRFVLDTTSLQALWNTVRIGIALSFGLLLAASAMSAPGVLGSTLLPAGVAAVFVSLRGSSMPSERGWNRTIRTVAILLPTLPLLLLVQLLSSGSPAGTWLLAGSLVASGAVAIQRSKIKIHRHFNHNDMFHVAMMAGYYFFYRGGLLLRDR